jgi:hypothetical protein
MRTDSVESMGLWFADEPDTNNQSGSGTAKDPATRKTTVNPNPNPTPNPDAGKK